MDGWEFSARFMVMHLKGLTYRVKRWGALQNWRGLGRKAVMGWGCMDRRRSKERGGYESRWRGISKLKILCNVKQ